MKRKISPIAFPLVEVVLKADNAKDDEYELVLRPAGTIFHFVPSIETVKQCRKFRSNSFFHNKFCFFRNVS